MDISKLLASLNGRRVRYVVIGAMAFPLYGYARTTLDVDILIEPTLANARRTIAALQEFGYDTAELTAQELLARKTLFRQYRLDTDIHPFAAGADFERVWQNSIAGTIAGIPAHIVSLDDMIRMKAAAGRAKDRLDLKALRALRARMQKRKTDSEQRNP
jgi:predicted nucleotidyltransferase